MIKSHYVVYDCETGGLDEEKNPITQYACVILEPKNLTEVDRWETFIKPYNNLEIEQEALDHTMVTMSDIRSGIALKDFVKTAKKFWSQYLGKGAAGRLISVGHNVPFDIRFVTYALGLEGEDFSEYFHPHFVDTMVLAKMMWGINGNEKIRLSDCMERAGLSLTDAHGAMNDVEGTADLFRFFTKKLRSRRGSNIESDIADRKRGQEFFEFRCVRD